MNERFHTIAADGVRLTLDLAVGHIRAFEVETEGKLVRPMHTAPWVDEAAVTNDPEILPTLKYLSGDFFCAPFCGCDVEAGPFHGWTANSDWTVESVAGNDAAVTARYVLNHRVMGARVTKELTLRASHPFVYQRHIFGGGSGSLPVASHGMTRFGPRGGRLSFSAKEFGELPRTQQESDPVLGRSRFAHPARFSDLGKLPFADGTTGDVRRYPIAERHEDFAMLVEARGSRLGWAAAARADMGDVYLSLKNPADFPVTFLWYSNGGRDYPPWNGRHAGVLGIEEGRSYLAYGHAASIAPNPLADAGIPTALNLVPNGTAEVRHVVGGVSLPEGWSAVADVAVADGGLRLTNDAGDAVVVPFDAAFLAYGER